MESKIIRLQFNNVKSIRELLKALPTEKKCEKFLKNVRWGKEVKSPYDENARVYKCSRNRYMVKYTMDNDKLIITKSEKKIDKIKKD